MSEARDTILRTLAQAYQIEVDGHTFYASVAARSDVPAVVEVFTKLANDEVQHKAYLLDVARRYEEVGTGAFAVARKAPDLGVLAQKVFSESFRQQAAGADFETSALSIGMTLESNAMGHFQRAADAASDAEVRAFYAFLADWERQHLDALRELYDGVRGDFFAAAGFDRF